MVTKDLERGLEELEIGGVIETIQTTALLRLVRIPKKALKNLRRLVVTQTSMKYLQLTCV